jgi:RNA polymerase sigma-70 factor (ECF subfamily)
MSHGQACVSGWRSIDSLPPRCKEIFLLSKQSGLRYKDIAEQLGISIKTVDNQIGKALKTIRAKIDATLFTLFLLFKRAFFKKP